MLLVLTLVFVLELYFSMYSRIHSLDEHVFTEDFQDKEFKVE